MLENLCLLPHNHVCLLVHHENSGMAVTKYLGLSLGLWNHIMDFMEIRFSIKKMVPIWLKFSALLPYLLDTLYCAVVNFPVSGSCTVARLSYEKRERTRTYSRSRQFWTFVLFCFAKPQVIGRVRIGLDGNGFKSAKTFRKVAIRKATSKS